MEGRRMLKNSLIFVVVLCAMVFAQEQSYIEVLKSDINTQRRALITSAMEFTAEEEKAFWPIYKEYEVEYDKLMDKEIQLIKEYAESYENMGDEVAKQLVKKNFENERAQLDLTEKYYQKFAKEFEIKRAVKLLQVLNRIELMINLQKVSNVPVLK
jgi:hypothetical protein